MSGCLPAEGPSKCLQKKHCSSTMLNSILAHKLHTEFKEGFYKRVHYIEAMLHQLKYTKS
jgi:hypothetical protein